MTATPEHDASAVPAERMLALEGLVASLGPANLGDSVAILLGGLHAGACVANVPAGPSIQSPPMTSAAPMTPVTPPSPAPDPGTRTTGHGLAA